MGCVMGNSLYSNSIIASAGMAGVMALTPTAFAQEASGSISAQRGGQLSEIIVTARKREESLIDVPVAVSAMAGEELQRKGVTDLERVSKLVPGVSLVAAPSGTGASFTIRGIGTPSLDPGLDQSVVIVLDGTPMTRGRVILTGMFDIAQVEVLKGPQALFFGKNSPAGVVSVTSAAPTRTLEGYVRAGYEFEAREKFIEGAISGPLGETLSGRLAFRGSDMRGWMKNVAQSLPNPLGAGNGVFHDQSVPAGKWGPGTRELMGRASLLWEPSPNFDALLRVSYGDRKDDAPTQQQWCDPAINPGIVTPVPGIFDLSDSCKFDNKHLLAGVPVGLLNDDWQGAPKDGLPFQDLKTLFTNLTMNYRTENLTFTSVTSYWDVDFSQASNYDSSSYGLAFSSVGEKTNSFSQELRLVSDFDAPVNFTLGSFYEEVDRKTYSNPLIFNVGPDPVTGRFDSFHSQNLAKAKTLSGFGQMRWAITDKLELAGGVRYTKEKRKQTIRNIYFNANANAALGPFVAPGTDFNVGVTDTNWSPEVSLSYKPVDDMLVYAAYKTGYKSGGFPAIQIFKNFPDGMGGNRFPIQSDIEFGPEKTKGGEIGFKTMLFDRTLRIEAVAYLYDYKDLQQSVFNPDTFSYAIFNAADARVKGLELQTEWAATPELRLNAAMAYNDAKFRSYPNGSCWPGQTLAQGCVNASQDLTGTRLPRAPEWEIHAGFSYDTPVSTNLMVGLSGDVSYRTKYKTQENQAPYAVQDGFALWNAGLRVYSADDSWELAFIGRNLANKYWVGLSTNTTFARTQDQMHNATPRARELRVQGTYRF